MQQKTIVLSEDKIDPKQTTQLMGISHIRDRFQQTFMSGKCPKVWMFYGPKGIGKATLAYQLARLILSDGDVDAMTNPEKSIFRQVNAGSHPDMMVIEREYDEKKQTVTGDIKVESVRQLNEFLSLTPTSSKYRVILIDGVDYLNSNAANALLKNLEEPPATTFFLLTCNRKEKLLATIPSRCLNIQVPSLTEGQVKQVLSVILPELTMEEQRILSVYAYGSPGLATNLYQYRAAVILPQLVEIIRAWPKINMHLVHQWLEQLLKSPSEGLLWHVLYMFYVLLTRFIMDQAGGIDKAQLLPFEQGFFLHEALGKKTPELAELVKELGRMIDDPMTLHMDKRVLLINLFEQLRHL